MKKGWVTKKLGEVASIVSSRMIVGVPLPLLDVKYLRGKTGVNIKVSGIRALAGSYVILVDGENSGEVFKLKEDGYLGSTLKAISIDKDVDEQYFFYFLALNKQILRSNKTGSAIPHLNRELFKTLLFPIPPLEEQKRIVAKIDAAFEKIDKLKANAEKNLANAKELFQSALDEAMRPKEHWVEKRLGEVYNFIDYRGKTPMKIKNGVPLVTARNVRMGYLDYSVRDFISYEEYETRQSRGVAHKGDLLFTTEAPLGFVAIADLDEFSTGQRLITFQQYENSPYELLNKFYFYYLQSKDFQSEIRKQATGATAQGIKASRLKDILVVVNPLLEQERIVRRLDLLADKIKILEQNYTQQIADCVEMRQAVLREAFEGRL